RHGVGRRDGEVPPAAAAGVPAAPGGPDLTGGPPGPDATMVCVSDALQVTDNQAESRFELWVDGLLAELPYRRNGKRLVLIHTEVPEELEGRGLGGALVTAAMDPAGADGLGAVALGPVAPARPHRPPAVRARAAIDWVRWPEPARPPNRGWPGRPAPPRR